LNDPLPAGVVVATPPNASTTCTGGTITAAAGAGVISYSGGTATAGAICTLQVDVTSATAGAYVNVTDDLTSSLGNSGPATANLTVTAIPTFAKSFSPDSIAEGGVSTLTFVIDNSANVVAATSLNLNDPLPAGVVVATPPNASTTCTGGTITAAAGAGVISYSGGTATAGA
ncbi:MAG: hypothetical protein GY797_06270, partial [Deltaproteobacteria bacterium]|nr:hypothetical protein [Deltaproteobacteria bacterium]